MRRFYGVVMGDGNSKAHRCGHRNMLLSLHGSNGYTVDVRARRRDTGSDQIEVVVMFDNASREIKLLDTDTNELKARAGQ